MNAVLQNWLETKVVSQVDTEVYFSISLFTYIPPKKKSYSKSKIFLTSFYEFEKTTERKQTCYFYFCCKGTSLMNGHVQIQINYE